MTFYYCTWKYFLVQIHPLLSCGLLVHNTRHIMLTPSPFPSVRLPGMCLIFSVMRCPAGVGVWHVVSIELATLRHGP